MNLLHKKTFQCSWNWSLTLKWVSTNSQFSCFVKYQLFVEFQTVAGYKIHEITTLACLVKSVSQNIFHISVHFHPQSINNTEMSSFPLEHIITLYPTKFEMGRNHRRPLNPWYIHRIDIKKKQKTIWWIIKDYCKSSNNIALNFHHSLF